MAGWLQLGRARLSAERRRRLKATPSLRALQLGRARLSAERNFSSAKNPALVLLQLGRARLSAERAVVEVLVVQHSRKVFARVTGSRIWLANWAVSKIAVVVEIVRLRRCERKQHFSKHLAARAENSVNITRCVHLQIWDSQGGDDAVAAPFAGPETDKEDLVFRVFDDRT